MDNTDDESKKEAAAANGNEDVDVNKDKMVPTPNDTALTPTSSASASLSPSPGVAKEKWNEQVSSTIREASSSSITAAGCSNQEGSRNSYNGKGEGEASSTDNKDSTSESSHATSRSCKDYGTVGKSHGETEGKVSPPTETSPRQVQALAPSEELFLPQPMSLPLSISSPRHQVSSPGAHRVQGRDVSRMAPAGPLTRVNQTASFPDGDTLEGGLPILDNDDQSNLADLSVARPVEEMNVSPHAAQPVARRADLSRHFSGSSSHDRNNSKRSVYHLAASLAVFFSIIVAVSTTSVLLVRDSSNGKNNSDATNRTDNLTLSTSSQDDDGNFFVLEQSRLGMALPEYTLEVIRNDKAGSSPQARGLAWILDDPNLSNYTLWQKRQRYALAILYYATNGDEWHLHPGWLHYNTSECFWETRLPVETYDDPNKLNTAMAAPTSRSCDEEGYYRTLDLTKNNLVGSIPPEIEFLASTLTTLSVKDNPLSSGSGNSLPEQIYSLTNLKFLGIAFCELTGTIPTQLGGLTQLTTLVVGRNNFQGTIPREIANLSHVRGLFMNYLGPRVMGTLPLLEWFGGTDTTKDHTRSGSFLSNLRTLHVHGNTGLDSTNALPTEIGNIRDLEKVLFGQVSFVGGTIPCKSSNTILILKYDYYSHTFHSRLPTAEIGLLTNMTVFNMRNSSISGSIPMELWNLTNMVSVLHYLFLQTVFWVPNVSP